MLARAGPHIPIIARIVADNMRALGVYSPAAHRAYFAQLATHFAGALHAFRCTNGPDGDLARIIARNIELDDSLVARFRSAALGRGAIIMGPHLTSYVLGLARLNQEIPLTIYFRSPKDARQRRTKERWCSATGIQPLFEPHDAADTGGRIQRLAAALGEDRTLYIPPDLPRKLDDGTPVRFFEREIFLPPGAAVLAVRTGAPLFMLLAERNGPRQRLVLRGPSPVTTCEPGDAGQRAAIQQHMQWFATSFERFLVEQTPLWYFWGDKRWTRVLRGDPRYVRPLAEPAADMTGAI